MKNKIITVIIVFIMILGIATSVSNAQTINDINNMALNDLEGFLNMNIENYTDGNSSTFHDGKSAFCMNIGDHGWANRMMRTYVVDVGKDGPDKVNGLSTKDSAEAQKAMEIIYYAVKAYQEDGNSLYRFNYQRIMSYFFAEYAAGVSNLFGNNMPTFNYDENWLTEQMSGVPTWEAEDFWKNLRSDAQKYAISTTNGAFIDRSTPNTQVIEEKDDWVFIGPYKIENTGVGSISDIVVTTSNGSECRPDGWSTSIDTSNINMNKDLPNGTQFYLAFNTQKPDSTEKIVVKKHAENILRARFVYFEHSGGQDVGVYGGNFDKGADYEVELPEVPFSSIKIVKVDKNSQKPLSNVGFRVYCEGQGYLKEGTPTQYVANKEDATTYITDQNGEITIRNLNKKGIYKIEEVVNPHFGYQEVSVNNPLEVGKIEITAVGQSKNITVTNERKYIKISGYVWEDGLEGKESSKNDRWDNGDRRVANVNVKLKKADGTIIAEQTTRDIVRKQGNETVTVGGAYLFSEDKNTGKGILISDLNGAYVEFEYNGMCYKSVTVYSNLDEGSKATDQKSRDTFNNNYATIVKGESQASNGNKVYSLSYNHNGRVSTLNYGGTYKYGYEATGNLPKQKYPISGINSQYMIKANTKDASSDKLLGQRITIAEVLAGEIEEIPNINLGLVEREMADLALAEDIDNIKLTLNGYEHTYKYGQRQSYIDNKTAFDVSVYAKNPYIEGKNRELYQSDVVYNNKNPGSLNIELKYKITANNGATGIYTKLNQIANYYDNRYEIKNITKVIKDANGNKKEVQIDKNDYQTSKYDDKYNKVLINTNINMAVQTNEEIYITYKLNNEAINSLLNGEFTIKSISEITSFSSYSDKNFNNKYAAVDEDSEPGNIDLRKENEFEDDTSSAPTLTLKTTNTRVIKGNVWEDGAIQSLLNKTGYDKERKGNGIYNNEENVIGNVNVELLAINVDENNNTIYPIAKLYQKIDNQAKEVDATTKTNEKGEYKFTGVIPGNYLIRYTYGDTSVIYNSKGEKVSELPPEIYKSTIYRGGNIQESEADLYWYRNEISNKGGTRLSDAKDNKNIVNSRIEDKEYTFENSKDDTTSITADTRKFEIDIECDLNEISTNTSEYGANLIYEFNNIDFGIIRRPIQNLEISKRVKSIKITLANGQVVANMQIDENGKVTGEKGVVAYVPKTNNSEGLFKVELDNELIQGAHLEVEYAIKVDNTKCEIDYNDENYYYYGTKPSNYTEKYAIATVKKLYDYISSNYDTSINNTQNSEWTKVETSSIKGTIDNKSYEYIKENNVFTTQYFNNMKPGTTKELMLSAERELSTQGDGLTFNNVVEVVTVGDRKIDEAIPGNYPEDEPDSDSSEEIIVTPNTGKNLDFVMPIIIGVTALIVLGVGIFVIKKKALNK